LLWLLVVTLGRRKRTEKLELQGCRRSRSSHCQEPLAGAGRVFPDITPFVSGGELKGVLSELKGVLSELKGVQSELKGAQGELKGVQSELKGAQGEQKLKLRTKELDKSPGGRGTPIYGLYSYVPRNRVWLLRFSALK